MTSNPSSSCTLAPPSQEASPIEAFILSLTLNPIDTPPTLPQIANGQDLPAIADEPAFSLDHVSDLDPSEFPPPPRRKGQVPISTTPNVECLLRSYRVTPRYDVIK